MKPSKDFDKIVSEALGEDILPVVKVLKKQDNVSEFKIAEKTKLEVNTVRNILYRLYEKSLVTFVRKKDKLKGWYIYYWTLNADAIKWLVKSNKKTELEKLRERLSREKNFQYYLCSKKCMRVEFEQAMDFQFKCPECGELLNQEDTTQKIADLESEIKKYEKELKK